MALQTISGETYRMLTDVVSQFPITENIVDIYQNFSGHINSTYILKTECGKRYILQKINTNVFKNPDELMSNIIGVTNFIHEKLSNMGQDPSRRTLHMLMCNNGKYYCQCESGCWRICEFVENTSTYLYVEKPILFYNCAKAFGQFQQLLADYPAEKLYETIPNFHNTVSRLADFKKAVVDNLAGRRDSVQKEIDCVLSLSHYCSYITSRIDSGVYPLRVTHNDTKLSNILFDDDTLDGICVIDLDTVMPGSVLYDFGDSIRFGACSTEEDETDPSKVHLRLDLYEEFTKGFLEGLGGSLSEAEILGLPYGALIITLETGMRFLGDYLNGDTYFSIHREHHNLDRARTQLALALDMEKNLDKMTEIAKKYGNL